MRRRLPSKAEDRFFAAAADASRFFMGNSDIHRAVERLSKALREADIDYAIVGALALGEYGYRRTTEDVDVLLTPEGLERFKRLFQGRGYVEKFAGSKGMRDTENNVAIDVVLAGDYPGDGKPKPVAFPDPAQAAMRGERISLLPLEKMIELKLASGMTAPHRLRDLADVLELIRVQGLDASFAERMDPYVHEQFHELVDAARAATDDEP
jgi:hypothetical protein